MKEKERFEILLEEVRGDVKIIAEGLVSLKNELRFEMHEGFRLVKQEISDLRTAFVSFAKKTDQRLEVLEAKVFGKG